MGVPQGGPGGQCSVHSYVHGLGVGLVSLISLEAPKCAHREVPDPEPSRARMGRCPQSSLGLIHVHSYPSNTGARAHARTHTQSSEQTARIHTFVSSSTTHLPGSIKVALRNGKDGIPSLELPIVSGKAHKAVHGGGGSGDNTPEEAARP